ncbi:hypothetical protein IRJ41_000965, partial [Triplophysa rosa]
LIWTQLSLFLWLQGSRCPSLPLREHTEALSPMLTAAAGKHKQTCSYFKCPCMHCPESNSNEALF